MTAPATEQSAVDPATVGTQFSLVVVGGTLGCHHCNGLSVVEVQCDVGVVGRLVSEHPWYLEVPDDIAEHPDTPHYEVDWIPRDIEGRIISFPDYVTPPTTLYFNAVEMMGLARKGLIPVEPKKQGKRKG